MTIKHVVSVSGGTQYSLLNDVEDTHACSSSYALCE